MEDRFAQRGKMAESLYGEALAALLTWRQWSRWIWQMSCVRSSAPAPQQLTFVEGSISPVPAADFALNTQTTLACTAVRLARMRAAMCLPSAHRATTSFASTGAKVCSHSPKATLAFADPTAPW